MIGKHIRDLEDMGYGSPALDSLKAALNELRFGAENGRVDEQAAMFNAGVDAAEKAFDRDRRGAKCAACGADPLMYPCHAQGCEHQAPLPNTQKEGT
jgi:hypothetical protein